MTRRLAGIARRDPNFTVSTPVATAAAPFDRTTGTASKAVRADGRMNVVFICADDFRSNTMIYGKEQTYTPNLARLAARGLTFDRAYAQITVCNPR